MKIKKIVVALIATLTILLVNTTTFAGNVYVQLNGELIDFTDANGNRVDAQIVNSRTMVPLRKIFELLGATVDWDNETRTAFAVKGDTSIKLQIDNPIAEVTEDGVNRKIQLDSKPILINDRTMVPLRFISESLGKQVAWDKVEQTAIIIDYDYFTNRIKQKSPMLYKTLTTQKDSAVIQISREYYDLIDATNNNVSSVYATISNDSENTQSILVDFTGNSELFNEIKKEGWGSVSLISKFDDEGFTISTFSSLSSKLNQMLINKKYTYEEFDLKGKYNDDFSEAIKSWFGVEEDKINVGTFIKMKTAFDDFLTLFTASNTQSGTTIKNVKITALTSNNMLNDYAAFDNIIFNNEFVKTFNVINKIFFNYDIKFEDVLYDYPTFDMTMNISENNNQIISTINIVLVNEFSEKVIYNVKVTK